MKLNYLMPVRILMGENCLFAERQLLAQLGKKALIVTGSNSARICGAYNDAVKALEANGQLHVLYDKVMANPTDICVYEAGIKAKTEGCDFILGCGGGSPMDAAKAAAVLAVNDISKEELFGAAFDRALPLALIPTTAGTGSETTPYSILTDTTGSADKTPMKRSVNSPLLFPRFAFLDAGYTKRLNRNTTINTAIDALTHAVEGMLCLRANYLSDMLAKDAITMIMDCMEDLLAFPAENPTAFPVKKREKLLLASSIAGMVIAQTGTALPHSMGYLPTINWGTDHGRANGLFMKSFLSWCREKEQGSTDRRIPALAAALGMEPERFFDMLELLLEPREKAAETELQAWSKLPMKNAANTYIKPEQEDIARIFRESLG
ncbi:MAG: iron-containing alcohol dehydrogenase [Spirochaetaceae bacterium]|jgi:alcohol dehydrogenase class IV|nr:iron-containing alcohol dehydrogenase [Spirochaetaceae bacterium]